ncbi:ZIP family metal transporter [Bdellovibrio sp. HCB337]|uniref:ZIP family metal transporter n=1 Tax=Bdellovibrio sp. HCB337 TaxID=3394358 RepID=UPI0039A53143
MSSLLLGTLGGLISCLSTCAGALPSLYQKQGTKNPWKFVSLDFTLGMMLAASAFSLILPAYKSISFEALGGLIGVSAALFAGVFFISHLGGRIAQMQTGKSEDQSQVAVRSWLFVTAMMIHNFPEGLASGASLNVENMKAGITILASICFQNLPEGLMTALAFQSLGMSSKRALLGAFLTGAMEFFGGFVGGLVTTLTMQALPYMLAFAGGAMLFVSSKELWAQTQGHPGKVFTNKSFALGFVLMASMSLLSL